MLRQFSVSKNYLFAAISGVLVIMLLASACSQSGEPEYAGEPQLFSEDAVDINTASAEELQSLPGVGEKMALRIIAFRETHGRFERPEDLLMVDGISDERFRRMRHLIRVDIRDDDKGRR